MIIVAILAMLAVIYCSIRLISHRQNLYRIGLFASIMLLLFSGGMIVNSPSNSPDQVVIAKTVKKITAKDKYQTAKKENVALIAKEKKLKKQSKKLSKQKKQIEKSEAQTAEQQTASQAPQQQQETHSQPQTDMTTSQSGQIVGNSNTHVYHVPGQRSYNMSSKNAVYFNTEQDAINAGYRRSQR